MFSNQISKQKAMFYLQRLFSEPSFLGPIVPLFYLERGLDFFEIMLLQVLFSAVFAVAQIPTDVIADKFGRKFSLTVGALLLGTSMLIIIVPNVNFTLFAISEILFGIGLAFRSGADTALMYNFLEKHNCSGDYSKMEGHANSKLIFGYLITKYDIFTLRIATGSIMIFIGVVLFYYMKKNLHERPISVNKKWLKLEKSAENMETR